jgi:hypothetical protein
MPKNGSRSRFMSLGGVVLAGLAGVVGVVLLASPAGAHNADLHGVATCDTQTGTYTVTYSGTADYLQLDPVVTVTSSSPDSAGVTVSPMSPPVASNGDYSITQTGIPASTTIASLKVHVYWTDSFTRDPEADVALPEGCSPPATPVTPGTPTFVDDTCSADDTAAYTIPDTKGVDYMVDNAKVDAGTHQATDVSTITITAVAQNGYTLTGTTTWTHTFPAAPTDCGTSGEAPAPTFTDATCDSPAASYTIPSSEHVSYQVNDVPAAAGKHTATAGTTVSIVAVAKPGFTMVGTKSWTHSFPATTTECVAGGGTGPVSGGPVASPPAPAAAPVLANTGLDVPAGKATIVGILLALFGGVCLWAGRRPTAPGRHAVGKV